MGACKGSARPILGIVFGILCIGVVIFGFFKLGQFEKKKSDDDPKKNIPECGDFGHFGLPNDCRCRGSESMICKGDQYCLYPNTDFNIRWPTCVSWDFKAMPKIDLHSHFDGSFDSRILFEAAKEKMGSLPQDLRDELKKCRTLEDFINLTSMPENIPENPSLDDMLKVFHKRILPIVKDDIPLLVKLAEAYIKERKKHNVLYAEVRYNPISLVSTDKSRRELVQQLGETFQKAETLKDPPVHIKQIITTVDTQQAYASVLVAIAGSFSQFSGSKTPYVVGVDIAGGETHFLQGDHHKAYVKAMDQAAHDKLNITITAGESGPGKNVQEAIDDYHASRIGHGYHYFMENNRAIAPEGIHFETCISSAWQTGAIPKSTEPHPIMEMWKRNVNMGINTGSAAVFRTDISNEYKVAMSLGFTVKDFHKMAKYQLEAVFDDSVKKNGKLALAIEEFYSPLYPPKYSKNKTIYS